uniref:Uncharacterized protein n=1 Tax=Candidatus Kentrum eta TaxID=2126337 RepID=A0A450U770_9GAMM|nr:MAG: hypothetical protein BECKH772A_GA0070896_100042 [Candidatus Kentron sp. H]VFJ89265.1 MAG: hypothetical protein BECKH772B_GA0070898_100042 [Candidatus Kentron sp. H]VFJ95875.1 MAG: hypothetical protein BECKH772C_GA0070978_100042 [Candidatus Kentron sp. H]
MHLILLSIPPAVLSYLLARDKGRNVAKWTILGAIPVVNMFCLSYFIGAANKKQEEKLDAILHKLAPDATVIEGSYTRH